LAPVLERDRKRTEQSGHPDGQRSRLEQAEESAV